MDGHDFDWESFDGCEVKDIPMPPHESLADLTGCYSASDEQVEIMLTMTNTADCGDRYTYLFTVGWKDGINCLWSARNAIEALLGVLTEEDERQIQRAWEGLEEAMARKNPPK